MPSGLIIPKDPGALADMRKHIRQAAYVYLELDTPRSSVSPFAYVRCTKTMARDLLRARPNDFGLIIQTLFGETDFTQKAVCLTARQMDSAPRHIEFLGYTIDAYTMVPHVK